MTAYLRIIQFWLFILVTIYLSLTSGPPDVLGSFSDKIIHCIGYFLLILSCDFAYRPSRNLSAKLFLLFIFSTFMEILQGFIPYRDFSGLDIIANITGLTWGLLVIIYLKGRVSEIA